MQIWPRGAWFGVNARVRRVALKVALALAALLLLFILLVHAYVDYEAHRAKEMLAEAARVRIGDSEASVSQFVKKYDGLKWVPETKERLGPRENWLDKEEYKLRLRSLSDFAYSLEANPWGFPNLARAMEGKERRTDKILRAVMANIPSRLRQYLLMRDWVVGVELSFKDSQVSRVSMTALVEGHDQWLGHQWVLATEMPHLDMPPRTYVIGAAFLSMADGVGNSVENFLTPAALSEQTEAAHGFNTACLTSIRGCSGSCESSLRTIQYLEKHPEAAYNIATPNCR
ncbi:MAG: hypothetical protein ACM3JB_14845 [Acidobacteriaceae bacterium]